MVFFAYGVLRNFREKDRMCCNKKEGVATFLYATFFEKCVI